MVLLIVAGVGSSLWSADSNLNSFTDMGRSAMAWVMRRRVESFAGRDVSFVASETCVSLAQRSELYSTDTTHSSSDRLTKMDGIGVFSYG